MLRKSPREHPVLRIPTRDLRSNYRPEPWQPEPRWKFWDTWEKPASTEEWVGTIILAPFFLMTGLLCVIVALIMLAMALGCIAWGFEILGFPIAS